MKRVLVENIQDGDVLARDVFSSVGVVLMSEGTILKKEYGRRLADLHILDVYVKDDEDVTQVPMESTEEELKRQCGDTVRETIKRYTYSANDELKEIIHVADNIMTDIMSKPEIMYDVSRVREKSNALYLHSMNVAAISTLIGLRSQLPQARVKEMAVGALLHDIGFTAIPASLKDVDLESCDEKTKKEIMRHVIYGYTEVEKRSWLSKTAKDIVLQHHERVDGTGYPFHMNGDHLSTEVKIVAVCDQFDSMIYGNMMPRLKVNDAMDYVMSQAGVLFDFTIVQLFMESVAAYPVGSIVKTNEGDTAVVIRQNYKFPTRPQIRLISNARGEKYKSVQERDLIKCLTLFITDTLDQ